VSEEEIYLLDDGINILIYVGKKVTSNYYESIITDYKIKDLVDC
jgi:hypothetical protein